MTVGRSAGRTPVGVRLLLAAAIGYGLAGTGQLVAAELIGDVPWFLWLANLLAEFLWLPAVLLLALALLAAWRWRSRIGWVAALACLAPATAWLLVFAPFLLPPLPTPGTTADGSATEQQLRVVSWNVRPRNPVRDLTRLVADLNPDLLLLQEVPPRSLAQTLAAVPGLPHHVITPVAPAANCCGSPVVLSRWPVLRVQQVAGLPARSRSTSLVTLDVQGRRLDVLALHLSSPLAGKGLRGVTDAAQLRVAETQVLQRVIAGAGPALIVGGDLNSGVYNVPRRSFLRAGLVDLQQVAGWGFGPTRGRIFRVDWLLARGVRAQRAWVAAPYGSDHRPVVAEVTLPRLLS